MANNDVDYVLAQLVDLVNRSELEFGITIDANGTQITGTLVSNQTWFDRQAQAVKAASQIEDNEVGLHTIFEGWRDVNGEAIAEDKKVEKALEGMELPDRFQNAIGEASQKAGYIHLAGARHVTSRGFVPTEGTLWRGRLEAVAGWSVGEIRQGDA
ncbi:hypothetical protein ACFCXL_01045 [[Kitasatospora] papulosa]|uniref:hypothetical protein n=1 Tax=[Kitasatospora] papulosa TaxID=1464011 RepID=UPI0035DBA4BD